MGGAGGSRSCSRGSQPTVGGGGLLLLRLSFLGCLGCILLRMLGMLGMLPHLNFALDVDGAGRARGGGKGRSWGEGEALSWPSGQSFRDAAVVMLVW